ncbi:hypothetical protein DFP93_106158 [Aneurinibacillus soli]|uniref:Uncharacterized protein n=1 Tax=Aneurinibacillus soli TaxID=1500254 RepID=A0A0U5CAJ2_9BACL|nr:hypothetical protein [Aneurinibacillus soli]PYE61964.1 hypothetical protein DFP93_106158 [Aneurinibacillus soli]BAU29779.1 hypothetical protein CB4_04016 [Aneurinibacillus soli]
MEFNKAEFAKLLHLAKGNRSINKFGLDSGVDPGYISRLMRQLIQTAPSAQIINKLASRAFNDVTVEHLMAAAGYLPEETKFASLDSTIQADLIFDPELNIALYDGYNEFSPEEKEAVKAIVRNTIETFKRLKAERNAKLDEEK